MYIDGNDAKLLLNGFQHKCVMRRHPPSDLETSPIGEILSIEIGFVENGPIILPSITSFCNLANVSFLCISAETRF
jgi:hypothetical protein